ncbi:hypothetical protein QR680_011192 [Steinernema hermaphroditum]|uniref:Uncharacterized protein n=1 Tax=Steinernema hermaphroditum TaxID=289476 RepID=A0AA39IT66_9BILA|nr:hypothetical protein QR680_011192 [Steinernema hermaphroditum]
MKSLFKIAAGKIAKNKKLVETLPKPIFNRIQKYEHLNAFKRHFAKFPEIPDECFVFKPDFFVNAERTLRNAEKILDPLVMFQYYLAAGYVSRLEELWKQYSATQKEQIMDRNPFGKYFADLFDYGQTVPVSNARYYEKARNFKYLSLSHYFFSVCPVPAQIVLLLSELNITLESVSQSRWQSNCAHLYRLLQLKNFSIDFNQMSEQGKELLREDIKRNQKNFSRLPRSCRIEEVDAFMCGSL